jgi:uncharacterized membrane protein YhiD involved in acid resistance
MNDKKLAAILGAVAAFVFALIVIIGIVGYFYLGGRNAIAIANSANSKPATTQASPAPPSSEVPFISDIFGTANTVETETVSILQIVLRLFLAVILSAILAFRPRKNVRLFERNLYVAQTQILLAVVAAALMMIVGDNAARAFAIFAAVSLVRFRTNIRDPKEVTVLLICLALGLAAGVGRWELGAALCLFVLILLRLLEYKEPEQAVRPMELTVKTRNTDTTQEALKKVFDRYKLETELRKIDPPNEKTGIASIMYYLNLRLNLSTDKLSDRISALDEDNIEGIQWEQKKSATDIYQ